MFNSLTQFIHFRCYDPTYCSDDPPVPPTVPVPPGGLLSTCLRLATTSGITASIKLKHSMDLSLPSSPVAISASTYNSPFCTMLINALKIVNHIKQMLEMY